MVLPLLIKDIRLSKKKNDIVLSHRDAPALHPIVRIVNNFMQDVRYRHIALQDGNDTRLPLVLDKAGNPSLGQVKVTSDDDIITLYHESMLSNELIDNQLNLLQGDDIFIDLTRNTGGYALSGGKGNDTLVGSTGDDTYLYARGDGHDSISEREGCDSLKFTFSDISKETLWLEKQEDDLIVLINGANSRDTLTIKHYYSEPESKIETIVASGFQLAGNNIETMVEAMSTFSAANNYYPEVAFSLLLSHVNLQTQIDTLWVAVPN